jgi:hypothetical protein
VWTSQDQIHLHYKGYTFIYNRIPPPTGLNDISQFYTKNKVIILEYLLPNADAFAISLPVHTECNVDVINPVASNISLYVTAPECLFILKLSEQVLSCMQNN